MVGQFDFGFGPGMEDPGSAFDFGLSLGPASGPPTELGLRGKDPQFNISERENAELDAIFGRTSR
jgi:hypothetical protein